MVDLKEDLYQWSSFTCHSKSAFCSLEILCTRDNTTRKIDSNETPGEAGSDVVYSNKLCCKRLDKTVFEEGNIRHIENDQSTIC